MSHAGSKNTVFLRRVKLVIIAAAGSAVVWNAAAGSGKSFGAGGAVQAPATARQAGAQDALLAKPYELPKDVFDLSFFDRFRQGQRLDVAAAQSALEALSDQNLPAAQSLFDETAWRAFIALNWPARPDGQPDSSKGYTDDSTPKVWEYWKQTSEVFLPDGGTPAPWGSTGGQPKSADHFKAGWRQTSDGGPTADQGLQAFSGPLVDQNGRWLHYTAMMNRPEFDYVVTNELYNLEGQAAYTQKNIIQFPVNDDVKHGAIEIKLAWKVLTDAEVKSNRFLVRRMPVVLYRPAASLAASGVPGAHLTGKPADNNNRPPVTTETVGLVGMHIAMRTRSSPQWIWATFEQIDNTRVDLNSGDATHPLPARPSLSNPDDPEALVGANLLPAYNAVGADGKPLNDWDESKPMNPVEVLRLVAPPPATEKVNRAMQSFLGAKGSVLRYYELIGTQWPKHPKAPAVPGGQGTAPDSVIGKVPGQMVPVYIINTTMETYFQKGFQGAGPLEEDDRVPQLNIDTTPVFGTESCAGCHYSAGACIGFRKDTSGKYVRDADGRRIPIYGKNGNDGLSGGANFSWTLQIEAKSKEK